VSHIGNFSPVLFKIVPEATQQYLRSHVKFQSLCGIYYISIMAQRTVFSCGSPFEAQIGYSRAVSIGDWVFVSGCTG